jgi:hypothetical protein
MRKLFALTLCLAFLAATALDAKPKRLMDDEEDAAPAKASRAKAAVDDEDETPRASRRKPAEDEEAAPAKAKAKPVTESKDPWPALSPDEYPWDLVTLDLAQPAAGRCLVACVDNRIVDGQLGNTQLDAAGTVRDAKGKKHPIITASGMAFSEDLATVVAAALRAKGCHAAVMPGERVNGSKLLGLMDAGKLRGVPVSLNISVKKWEVSVGRDETTVEYDLFCMVSPWRGKPLAKSGVEGVETLAVGQDKPRQARAEVIRVFKAQLEQMLDDKKLLAALEAGEGE